MLCPSAFTASRNIQQGRQLGTAFKHCSKICQSSPVTALSTWLLTQPLQKFPFSLQTALISPCCCVQLPKNTCHLSTSTTFGAVWLTDTFQLDRLPGTADKHSILYYTLHSWDCLHLKHQRITRPSLCPAPPANPGNDHLPHSIFRLRNSIRKRGNVLLSNKAKIHRGEMFMKT